MIPDLQPKIDMLCLGAAYHSITFGVELMGLWVARYCPISKESVSLTLKVFPLMEPIQKKGSHCPSLLAQPKDWQLMFIFPSRLRG